MRRPILSAHPFAANAFVLIEPEVLQLFDRYRQNAEAKPEAGGILLGYRRGAHLHVVEATGPARDDRRRRYSFHRGSEPHQSLALQRWRASSRLIQYLGEWHCHPERHPTPSPLDLASWQEIYRAATAPMLFVIAGIDTEEWYGLGYRDRLHRFYPLPGR